MLSVNTGVVAAFLAGASQWRTGLVFAEVGPRLRYLGLDYQGVKVSIEALGMTVTPELWAGVMVMELAAAAALNRD